MDNLDILGQTGNILHWVYKGYDGTSVLLGGQAQSAILDDSDIELKVPIRKKIRRTINEYLGYEEPKEDPCYGCMSQCHINCPIGRDHRWRPPE
jgi:hypothetical protein